MWMTGVLFNFWLTQKHFLRNCRRACLIRYENSDSLLPSRIRFGVAFAKAFDAPQDDISQVIVKARAYVEKEKIDVSGCFIQRVEFKNQYDEHRPQYWEVVFLKVSAVKGGHIIVDVYNDGKIDHGFGE